MVARTTAAQYMVLPRSRQSRIRKAPTMMEAYLISVTLQRFICLRTVIHLQRPAELISVSTTYDYVFGGSLLTVTLPSANPSRPCGDPGDHYRFGTSAASG